MKIALRNMCVTIAFATSLAFCQAGAPAADITAEGIGQGTNKEEALSSAKRDALEKGFGQLLLSQTEVENFMVKRDQIITKTMGSVKSYEVLSESNSSGMFEVKIKAVLAASAMRQDLAAFHILLESMEKPRTMVVIKEVGVEPESRAAEAAIIKFLKDPYEFDIVDQQVSDKLRASDEKMAQLSGSPAAAAAIGNKNGAEVMIVGESITKVAENTGGYNLGGMKSVQADVTLRAINCTTGKLIATAGAHGAAVHISAATAANQSVSKAATKAAQSLLDAIVKEWQNQQNNGTPLSVSIANVSTFKQKTDLVRSLETVSGIASVKERSWDAESKTLTADITYKGNTSGFSSRLDGFKLKAGGNLSVTAVKGNNVSLSVQAAQ